jgi:hypothetical protein
VKKKTEKKLVLAKETVRKLEDGQLGEVVGGTTFYMSCIWRCIRSVSDCPPNTLQC